MRHRWRRFIVSSLHCKLKTVEWMVRYKTRGKHDSKLQLTKWNKEDSLVAFACRTGRDKYLKRNEISYYRRWSPHERQNTLKHKKNIKSKHKHKHWKRTNRIASKQFYRVVQNIASSLVVKHQKTSHSESGACCVSVAGWATCSCQKHVQNHHHEHVLPWRIYLFMDVRIISNG